MQVHHAQPRTRNGPFTPSEDTLIARHHADGVAHDVIGAKIGRTGKAIQGRIYILRKSGVIPGYSPRRAAVGVDTSAFHMAPPINLRCDDDLIRATLMAGGLPRAVLTSIGTIWAAPDGMPWRYGRAVAEARA